MTSWQTPLKYDPVAPLLSSENEAIGYFARRDLLDEDPGPVSCLWRLPAAQKILKKQQPDGSWPRPGVHKHEAINDELIETWKQFRFLVQVYGFTRDDPAASRAAEFLFSCQTGAGDIRGFLANQYCTYYTGAILSLLIQAGYEDDPRVEKGLQWLLSMRQDDMGWSIPMITYKLDQATIYRLSSEYAPPLEPDRSKPFSHNATGMVIRAFAAHCRHRRSEAARSRQACKSRGSSSPMPTPPIRPPATGSGSNTPSGGTTSSPRSIPSPSSTRPATSRWTAPSPGWPSTSSQAACGWPPTLRARPRTTLAPMRPGCG